NTLLRADLRETGPSWYILSTNRFKNISGKTAADERCDSVNVPTRRRRTVQISSEAGDGGLGGLRQGHRSTVRRSQLEYSRVPTRVRLEDHAGPRSCGITLARLSRRHVADLGQRRSS